MLTMVRVPHVPSQAYSRNGRLAPAPGPEMQEEHEITAGALERRLFELSHDGMLVASLDGLIARVNGSACRITGRPQSICCLAC